MVVRLPYRPNKSIIFLVVFFFAVCAVSLTSLAMSNEKDLMIAQVVRLSPQSATVIYWMTAIAALLFFVVGGFVLVRSVIRKREIVITNESITSPVSAISTRDMQIYFSEVTAVEIQVFRAIRILQIKHPGGMLSIPSQVLPSKADFEELICQLKSRALRR